jgi:hypothetical protein
MPPLNSTGRRLMSCRCRCRRACRSSYSPAFFPDSKTGRGGSGTGFGVRCQARRRTRDRGFRGERDFGARPFEGIFPAILDSLCGDFLSSLGSKCQMITTQYVVLCSSRPRLQRLGCLFGRGARRFHRLGIRQHVPLLPACTLLAFRVCPPAGLEDTRTTLSLRTIVIAIAIAIDCHCRRGHCRLSTPGRAAGDTNELLTLSPPWAEPPAVRVPDHRMPAPRLPSSDYGQYDIDASWQLWTSSSQAPHPHPFAAWSVQLGLPRETPAIPVTGPW